MLATLFIITSVNELSAVVTSGESLLSTYGIL